MVSVIERFHCITNTESRLKNKNGGDMGTRLKKRHSTYYKLCKYNYVTRKSNITNMLVHLQYMLPPSCDISWRANVLKTR